MILPKKLTALTGTVLLASVLGAPAAHAQTLSNPGGPITTDGSEILNNGVEWIPYGFTLSNFQNEDQTYVPGALSTIEAEMNAVVDDWHGNTVRIQILQDEYLNPTPHTDYASNYYQTLVIDAIDYAESLGLVVVINDQTEANPETNISSTSPGMNVGNAAMRTTPLRPPSSSGLPCPPWATLTASLSPTILT
jgi:Cellulase (glycosyl hydrolase family 5)